MHQTGERGRAIRGTLTFMRSKTVVSDHWLQNRCRPLKEECLLIRCLRATVLGSQNTIQNERLNTKTGWPKEKTMSTFKKTKQFHLFINCNLPLIPACWLLRLMAVYSLDHWCSPLVPGVEPTRGTCRATWEIKNILLTISNIHAKRNILMIILKNNKWHQVWNQPTAQSSLDRRWE